MVFFETEIFNAGETFNTARERGGAAKEKEREREIKRECNGEKCNGCALGR